MTRSTGYCASTAPRSVSQKPTTLQLPSCRLQHSDISVCVAVSTAKTPCVLGRSGCEGRRGPRRGSSSSTTMRERHRAWRRNSRDSSLDLRLLDPASKPGSMSIRFCGCVVQSVSRPLTVFEAGMQHCCGRGPEHRPGAPRSALGPHNPRSAARFLRSGGSRCST